MAQQRYLIMIADDFGIGPETSAGILDLAARRLITGSVLLVTSPHAESGVAAWRRAGMPMELGWHPCLTLDKPILPAKRVPTLVRSDGSFFSLKTFLKRLMLGRIASEEVEAELCAQHRRFCELVGKPPAIVNCHQHVNVFHPIGVILLKLLGERWPLPHVRRVQEPWHMLWQIPGAKAKRTLLNVLGRRLARAQNSLGFPGADWLVGITNPNCFQDPLFYSRWLTRVPGTTVEVACHPGHRDLTLLGRECKEASDPLIQKRVHDYSLIKHADFLDTCQQRGFVLASPQEAAQSQPGKNQAA